MPSRKYKALIFDLGNVIIDISPKNACDYWAKVNGILPGQLYLRFPFDDVYAQFERGEISPDFFRSHVTQCLEIELTPQQFDEGWSMILIKIRDGISELLHNLSKHYRVFALSNTNEIHVPMWQEMCTPILPYFEKIFSSNEIGFRKPEKESFVHVLDYLDLVPEEVIFLDDNYENVIAAEEIGMKAVHVIDYEQMMKELTKIGIM
ncbi:MAG: HAD family phosphatase [Candidatus Cloacimonetes bacterium]|nr:HAD family phosphatase [Candidatus Cloacimonadota bacterium]